MFRRTIIGFAFIWTIVAFLTPALGEDAFYQIPYQQLHVVSGKLPEAPPQGQIRIEQGLQPYVVLDGPGEVYWASDSANAFARTVESISVRAPAGQEVSGRLFAPFMERQGMAEIRFTIPASAATRDAETCFYSAKKAYYERLQERGIPGGAWFRYQARKAAEVLKTKPADPRTRPERVNRDEVDETYGLFTGGRAISENLQLDRALPPRGGGDGPAVDINSIRGITVAEFDWKPLIKDLHPQLDPLASAVPADQYAIFVSNFDGLVALADEAEHYGAPVLQTLEPRSEDAMTRRRYERQLGLSLTGLGKLLGPQLIKSVAITGSDPYLRTGGDIALLFEPTNANTLASTLRAQIGFARQQMPNAIAVDGNKGGIAFSGAESPDRRLRTYLAVLNDHAVVVTNSKAELERLAAVERGETPALSKADEYTYFRDRYRRGQDGETALLVLTDATIRRWCGPKWRIADSRRTRAAANLSDLQAGSVSDIVSGNPQSKALPQDAAGPDLGELRLGPDGVSSSIYGSLGFMTPISELDFSQVTHDEASAYERWRDSYQQNWRNWFDPIAVRFSINRKKLAADLTITPLIASSEYAPFITLTQGANIMPDSGDPHETLLRLALAINIKSEMVQRGSNLAMVFAPNLKAEPFSWLGQSVGISVDDDPFWSELAKAEKQNDFFEHNFRRLPVALYAQVSNGLKLTGFLVALRAYIEQTAPGMTVWENLTYKGRAYVRIGPSAQATGQNPDLKEAGLYYAASGDMLILTPSEDLLHRALDRQIARQESAKSGKAAEVMNPPWLGSSLCLQADRRLLDIFFHASAEGYQSAMQQRAWSNLPILNEWKRLYPDRDPLKVHETLFQAQLIDPAGGGYVWNDRWRTMESTIYGNPAEPKAGPQMPAALSEFVRGNFGITFENQGLRARAELDRKTDIAH